MTNSNFYITGGTLPANATSYIDRDADELLFRSLMQGEFCYVLTSRQMGKSSLMTRTVRRLREHGVAATIADPSGQGFELDARQWYNGLLYQIAAALGVEAESEAFRKSHSHLSPLQLWHRTLREVVLNSVSTHITIFIDEIDIVRNLPFSTDELFAAIRACYNARHADPAYLRLNFCLLGVCTPADLIANTSMTPFNIGTRVELRDFTRHEISHLENGLGRSAIVNRQLMDRIFYWTCGHPYLTQRLCLAVAENGALPGRRCVDACVKHLFLSANSHRQESNILFVNQRMLLENDEDKAGLLTLYARIRNGESVPDSETGAYVTSLKLAGIVGVVNSALSVSNRIYRRVFDRKWITDKMPGAEQRRQQLAYRRGLVRASAAASAVVAAMGLLTVWAVREQNQANWYRSQADKSNIASQQRLRDSRRASYTITMNLIQREWDLHDINRVLDLLEATKNSEYRGFEWGYWNQLCHVDLVTLKGHNGIVNAVDFSPDGNRVVTGCRDGYVRVWETETGRELLTFAGVPSHDNTRKIGVTSIAFSRDGKRIAVGCDITLGIYSSTTGKCLWNPGPDAGAAMSVAFSADGRHVAAGITIRIPRNGHGAGSSAHRPERDDQVHKLFRFVVKVWDAASGRVLLTLPGHSDGIKSVRFSRDGSRIASGSYDRTARIWNSRTGRQILEIKDPTHVITSVAFSPDGTRLVTAFKRVFEPDNRGTAEESPNESTVKVWDAYSGRETMRLQGYMTTVKSVAFTPDGQRISTAGWDNTSRIWDAATGREEVVFRGHTDYVDAVAFSSDGKRLVTGSYDRTAKVWNSAAAPGALVLSERGARVTSVAASKDGKLIATGSGTAAATWDPTTGRENVSYNGSLSDSNLSRAGNEAEVRNARNGNVLLHLVGHHGDISSVAFSPNNSLVVTGSYDGTARVWNTRTGRETLALIGHADAVTSVAFSPDGSRIITGSLDRSAKIWDAVTGHKLLSLEGQARSISSVAISPDGKYVVTGSSDKTAKMWDALSGRQLLTLTGHTDEVLSVAFSPDGTSIVLGSADNTAIVWDRATGTRRSTLTGHSDNINSLAYSPDGKRIVTGSDDHTAKIWDSETGQELLTLRGHTRAIHGVCFSADGNSVITGSWDKTTRIWRVKF